VRHRLSDDEWDLIADLFPEPTGVGRPPNKPRDMMDGILWVLRTGAPWRDIPPEIGKWQSVWDAFNRWNKDGTLGQILARLMASHVDVGLVGTDLWLVDGTVVRAARCAAGGGKEDDPDEPDDHGLGRSRGGFSTKIHLVSDDQGHPLAVKITPGQEHESQSLCELIESIKIADHDGRLIPLPDKLAGDKGYRAEWIDDYLLDLGITPVIPSKANEDPNDRVVKFDRQAYRSRNIIERLIGWLKESRRILTRFEKTAQNYLGMIRVAFIHRYLRLTCS